MSELKKKSLLEQENIKQTAQKILKELTIDDTLFIPSMVDECEQPFKVKVLNLVKSYLRRERRKLIDTKKAIRNNPECVDNIKKQIQKIDFNIEIITQHIQYIMMEQSSSIVNEKKIHKKEEELFPTLNAQILNQIHLFEQQIQTQYQNHLECLYQMKITYDRLLQQTRRNYRLLQKLIEINYEKNNLDLLQNLLNELVNIRNDRTTLLKIIHYIEKMLHTENKEKKRLQRNAKRLVDDICRVEEYEEDSLVEEQDELEDVIEIYIEKIAELRDIDEVLLLLNNYPELYEIKDSRKKYLLENILDKYFNIIINRNMEKPEVLEVKEYLERLLKAYINFGAKTDNDFYNIIQSKINRVFTIIEKNNYDVNRQKTILISITKLADQLHYYKRMNMPKREPKKHTFEKAKTIITIDNDKAKVFEDAVSIQKKDSSYELILYVSDVASFVLHNSIQDINAQNEFMHTDNNMFSKAYYKRFSLDQGKNRYAYAYIFNLTTTMDVKEFSVKKVKLRVNKNFNFKQASEALMDTKNRYHETMKLLQEVSQELLHQCMVSINKNGVLTPSDIVEIQICFAKNFIAKYCSDNHLPLILQNRALMYGTKLHELMNASLDEHVYSATEKRDLFPTGEFTSPARSYISLFNQRLHQRYFISKKELDEAELISLCAETEKLCNIINENKYGYQKVK